MTRRATGLVGTCGACGGEYRVLRIPCAGFGRTPLILSIHGFRKPRGYHVGRCDGAEKMPHELWPVVAVEHREDLRDWLASAEDVLATYVRGEFPEVIKRRSPYRRHEVEEFRRGDPGREHAERDALYDARSRRDDLRFALRDVEDRIANWQLGELRRA